MTKEELEKEAEEKYVEVDREFIACQDEGEVFNIGYVLGAEPREKQIQIDAKQIRALQKQNGELTDKVKELEVRCNELFLQTCEQAERVKELEAQIEKMKCCEICMYKGFGRNFEFRCSIQGHIIKNPFEEKCDKWEIEK